MKRLLALFTLLIIITPTNACLMEYRVVKFKPIEGKQEVLDDFVFNFSNPFNFTISNVSLSYHNLSIHIPVMRSGELINSRYNVTPKDFKLNISCNIKGDARKFKVIFTIFNGYSFPVRINLTFPKPSWIMRCENCSIIGNEIVFNETVINLSKFSLIGKGSGKFVLKDGKIKFHTIERANLSFSTEIPFSVTKYRLKDRWFAVCSVENDKDIEFNVTIYCYVNESKPPHNFNKSKPILVKFVTLKPKQNFNITVNSSAKLPAFFVKVKPIAKTACNVTVFPATKIGRHYVQYGTVEGFSFTITPIEITPPPIGGGGGGVIIKPIKQFQPKSKSISSVSTPSTKILPRAPSSLPLIYPVVRGKGVISSVFLGGIKINQIKADKYTVGTLLPITFLPVWMMLPLFMARTRVIFDSAVFKPEEIIANTHFIVPKGAKIGRIIPSNIEFEEPDFELVRYIHEVYDIPLNPAKAIALSLETGYPVFLSDRHSWRIAIELGCEAYLRR